MKKTVLIVMIITIISKVFGFGREVLLSYLYGASSISDAYIISMSIPSVIFGFVSAGIIAGFIPLYSKIWNRNGEIQANYFLNNLINALLVIVTISIIISILFTEELVKLFAPGFSEETFNTAVKYTQISMFAIYFTIIVAVFKGFLEYNNKFIVTALIGLPQNIIIVLSLIIGFIYNELALPIGYVAAIASQLLFMIYFIRNLDYRYQMIINVRDQNLITMGKIALPAMLGISVNQINILVDKNLASQIAVGGISAINYASTLNGFVFGIFVLPIVTVLYPKISKLAAEKNTKDFKRSLYESINGINFLLLPVTVGSIIFSTPIISIIYGRGAFDTNAIKMTSTVLTFYSIGMIGYGLRELISKVFYSMQDTKTPVRNAMLGMILNIVFSLILSRYLGIGGLALATSFSALITTTLLFISLRKKIGSIGLRKMSRSFLKILISSIVMGFIAKFSFEYLTTAIIYEGLSLIIAIVIGSISYCVMIYQLKVDGVVTMINTIKRKLRKNNR